MTEPLVWYNLSGLPRHSKLDSKKMFGSVLRRVFASPIQITSLREHPAIWKQAIQRSINSWRRTISPLISGDHPDPLRDHEEEGKEIIRRVLAPPIVITDLPLLENTQPSESKQLTALSIPGEEPFTRLAFLIPPLPRKVILPFQHLRRNLLLFQTLILKAKWA